MTTVDFTASAWVTMWRAARVVGEPTRLAVLAAVHEHDGEATPTTLSMATGLSSAGLTHVLDALAARGLITKRSHATDRRSWIAVLEKPGEDLLAAFLTAAREAVREGTAADGASA